MSGPSPAVARHCRVVVVAAADVSLLHRLAVLDGRAQLFVLETIGSRPRESVWTVLAGAASDLMEVEQLVTAVGSQIVFMPLWPFSWQTQVELDRRTMRQSIARASDRLASVSESERIAALTHSALRCHAVDRDRSAVIARVSVAQKHLEQLDDVVLDCKLAGKPLPLGLRQGRAEAVTALALLHDRYCQVNGGVPEVWPF
jgi:hypothetical protein